MALSAIHTGWGFRQNGGRENNADFSMYYSGTEVGRYNATAFSFRAGVGVTITDTGLTIIAGGATITAGGLTVTAGGVTVTAGGVAITDGALVVRGDARIRESMGLADNTTNSDQTYTAAQLVGGIITRDPNGSARTDTTATGTEIETELNAQGIDVATGDTFTCLIVNTANGAEAITIGGGSGVAISNAGQTIAQNESALLLFRRTGANAFTCYILGA